jgi:nitric oxide reductase activation protein
MAENAEKTPAGFHEMQAKAQDGIRALRRALREAKQEPKPLPEPEPKPSGDPGENETEEEPERESQNETEPGDEEETGPAPSGDGGDPSEEYGEPIGFDEDFPPEEETENETEEEETGDGDGSHEDGNETEEGEPQDETDQNGNGLAGDESESEALGDPEPGQETGAADREGGGLDLSSLTPETENLTEGERDRETRRSPSAGPETIFPGLRESGKVTKKSAEAQGVAEDAMRRAVGPSIARLGGQLRRLLQAQSLVRLSRHKESGSLITRDLARAKVTGRPFGRYNNPQPQPWAVAVLIDGSYSMEYTGDLRRAHEAALALSEALRSARVPHEVSTFTVAYKSKPTQTGKVKGGRDGRDGPSVTVLREFDARPQRGDIGRCETLRTGDTNTGTAIMWAGARLSMRKEKRKLIVTLEDGDSNFGIEPEEAAALVKEQWGVQTVAVGIGPAATVSHYEIHERAEDTSRLPEALLRAVTRAVEATQ